MGENDDGLEQEKELDEKSRDYHDPFLGDKYFFEDLIFVVENPVKEILDRIMSPESVKTRIQDIRRGIRIYLDRTDKDSKKRLKEDFIRMESGSEKAVWLFVALGRCFYG